MKKNYISFYGKNSFYYNTLQYFQIFSFKLKNNFSEHYSDCLNDFNHFFILFVCKYVLKQYRISINYYEYF